MIGTAVIACVIVVVANILAYLINEHSLLYKCCPLPRLFFCSNQYAADCPVVRLPAGHPARLPDMRPAAYGGMQRVNLAPSLCAQEAEAPARAVLGL